MPTPRSGSGTKRRTAKRARPEPPSGSDPELAARLLRTTLTIRHAELRMLEQIETAGFGGLWHPGIGQEGIHAGLGEALRRDDYFFYTHRGLGGPVAKGLDLVKLFGDLLAKTCGSTGGKGGGTPHFADPEIGLMGFGGTLGSCFVMAAGTALASQIRGDDRVTLAVFGEGAAARGPFNESALEASVAKLPVVWLCENNGLALSAPYDRISPTPNIADRAVAYDMPGVVVDGQDAVAVHVAVADAVERARSGGGPTLVEAKTQRLRGHYEGDQQKYREAAAPELGGPDDPVVRLREHVDAERADELDREAEQAVRAAFDVALAAPGPDPGIIFEEVFA